MTLEDEIRRYVQESVSRELDPVLQAVRQVLVALKSFGDEAASARPDERSPPLADRTRTVDAPRRKPKRWAARITKRPASRHDAFSPGDRVRFMSGGKSQSGTVLRLSLDGHLVVAPDDFGPRILVPPKEARPQPASSRS